MYIYSILYPLYLSNIKSVPPVTEPGISLIILPLMRILQRNLKQTTDTLLFISHKMNVLLFKFRCNILIGVRIIKEMPGSVVSGTLCMTPMLWGFPITMVHPEAMHGEDRLLTLNIFNQ